MNTNEEMKKIIKHTGSIEELAEICPPFRHLEGRHIIKHSYREWFRNTKKTYDIQVIFLGGTGAGKSTTINSMAKQDIMITDDISACTKECQCADFTLSENNTFLSLVDFPGVGESINTDEKYLKIYAEFLEKTDVLLYVLRADTRDYVKDEKVFERLLKNSRLKDKIVLGINFSDKIEPINRKRPFSIDYLQEENLLKKSCFVSERFEIPITRVITYSSKERWKIRELSEEIVRRITENQCRGGI